MWGTILSLKSLFRHSHPLIRQYDLKDCGPAALLSVLKFYEGNSSLPYIRELCNTNINGSTMFDLVNAAKKIGFKAFGASGEYEDLMKERMPVIAHVVIDEMLNHFVVVYKIKPDKIFIADPGKGKYWLKKEEFLKIWKTKSVILLEPGNDLFNKRSPRWFEWLYSYIKKEETWVYQSLFLGTLYTILGLATALFVQLLLDKFIPGEEYTKIILSGLFLGGALLIRAFSGYLRQRFLVILNRNINTKINSDFLEHLFKLPKKFFSTRSIGEITARINDAVRIQRAILQVVGITLIDCFVIIGSIGLMFYFSKSLTLLCLLLIPIYAILLFISVKKLKTEQNEVMKGYALVESNYFDSLRGIDEIIGYNTGGSFANKNKYFFKNYQDKVKSLGFTQANLTLFAEAISSLILVGLLITGAVWVVDGKLLIGEMMAAYSLLANIIPAVNRFIDANIILQETSVASTRLMDMLHVEGEKIDGKHKFVMNSKISIKNGSFSWNGRTNLFEDINLNIERGKITSLWGNSGVGKSTIVNILQRKYNLSEGEITLNNISADLINMAEYRKKVAVVPQVIKIFNGTIAENILLGRTINDFTQLEKRITKIGLRNFYGRFEHGLATVIGEDGRELSGGEQQLISITRALFESPEVLIIDEGLSGIDVELEKLIFDVIKKYSTDNAVLLITHNLNSILKTDYVYVISGGKILQKGTPEELINNTGRFNSIWKMKNELYGNNKVLING